MRKTRVGEIQEDNNYFIVFASTLMNCWRGNFVVKTHYKIILKIIIYSKNIEQN